MLTQSNPTKPDQLTRDDFALIGIALNQRIVHFKESMRVCRLAGGEVRPADALVHDYAAVEKLFTEQIEQTQKLLEKLGALDVWPGVPAAGGDEAKPVKLSDFDRDNVANIVCDRRPWSEYTNYGAHVLRMVKKADAEQREVLRRVYPDHVAAVEAWEWRL
jgi:hypothetical protein